MSGPPPPPPRPSGERKPMASALAAGSTLRPSARARLGAVAAPPPPPVPVPAPAPAPASAPADAEQSLNATRVGNHFVSTVTPSDEELEVPSSAAAAPAPAPTVDAPVDEAAAPTPTPTPVAVPAQVLAPAAPLPPVLIGEKDVMGFGAQPNVLQLPSPVYLAEWIDDAHILLGAGGGGRRFGMANVLVVLKIDTTVPATPAAAGAGARGKSKRPDAKAVASAAMAAEASGKMAQYVAAIELGNDIPWCTSHFLPYSPEEAGLDDTLAEQVARHCPDLVGFFAVSSITCFYLVAVHRAGPPTAAAAAPYTLTRLARITVPNDARNPDKKPIALVHNALVVAHDDAGVLVYRLSSLLPSLTAPSLGTEKTEEAGTALVEDAVPAATWKLPARANDVHANRLNLVCAKKASTAKRAAAALGEPSSCRTPSRGRSDAAPSAGTSPARFVLHSPSPAKDTKDGQDGSAAGAASDSPACRALLLNYLVIAAAVQDKTVRVASLRLRRRDREERTPAVVTEQAALSGKDLGLDFPLLGSSLRLVRLFALENLRPADQELARRALVLRDLGALPTDGRPTPLASLLIVVFSLQENRSFFIQTSLEAALERGAASVGRSSRGSSDSRHGSLRLRVRAELAPAPLLRDSITCLSAIAGPSSSSSLASNLFGASVPQDWVVGSIEGWLARIQATRARTADDRAGPPFVVASLRPSRDKREAKRFPALHTEPVSCVAVSPSGVDVITTDIVQNVIISTIPPELVDTSKAPLASASGAPATRLAAQQHRTDIRLFPREDDDVSVWALFSDLSSKERAVLLVALSIVVVLLAMMFS